MPHDAPEHRAFILHREVQMALGAPVIGYLADYGYVTEGLVALDQVTDLVGYF